MVEQLPLYRHRWHQRLHDRVVSRLLWAANTSPPPTRRTEFYALKQRLCERYGILLGHDWQYFEKKCWGCDDTVAFDCIRCNGTGIYERYHVKLERWQFGPHIFHRPLGRFMKPVDEPVTIKGYIQHARIGRWSREAVLWLALVYDRRLFWGILRSGGYLGWYWQPMCNLQRVVSRLYRLWRWIARQPGRLIDRFRLQTCVGCQRRFRALRHDPAPGVCGECLHRWYVISSTDDEEIPF